MTRRCSDRRLERLVRKVLLAIEDPARGIVFDDFDLRYREKERKREMDAAHWFYRDKTSFETKYAADCGNDPCNEPAWVTDGGRGKAALEAVVSYDLDGEDIGGPPTSRAKCIDRAKHRVMRKAPECLRTFWLVIRNGKNRKESIWQMLKSRMSRKRSNGTRRGTSTGTT